MASASSSAPVGFGIIGVGLIADFHARAIAAASGARLVGVWGRSETKAKAFAEKHAAPFWTTDLDALLARPDLQAVCVVTPSGAHLEPALAAAQAGKHVVMEKPIEITLERMDRLIAAVRAAGVHLLPIFQARFGPGAAAVKQAIASGRLGRLTLASAYVKWLRSADYYRDSWHGTRALDGGGALINQAIHGIDLLQWFAGMPTDVFAFTTRRVHTGIEGEDTAVASLRFASGALGTIEASTAAHPGWARRIEICGEQGSVVLEDDTLLRWDFKDPLPEDAALQALRPDPKLRSGASAPGNMTHVGHQVQIQSLVDTLQRGTPLLLDGPEARKAVALVLALYESATRGQPVKLPS